MDMTVRSSTRWQNDERKKGDEEGWVKRLTNMIGNFLTSSNDYYYYYCQACSFYAPV